MERLDRDKQVESVMIVEEPPSRGIGVSEEEKRDRRVE